MSDPRTLAGLLGPVLTLVAATEALNLEHLADVGPAHVYLNGTLLLTAGVAIVRTQSSWTFRWTTLLTLVGWAAVLGGVYRMTFPEGAQAEPGVLTYLWLALLGGIGVVLTLRSRSGGDDD